jgi:hypothetical protein
LFFEITFLKPEASTATLYKPTCTLSKTYVPVSDVVTVKLWFVASFVTVTFAPGIADPEESVTVPVARDVVPCPDRERAKIRERENATSVRDLIMRSSVTEQKIR